MAHLLLGNSKLCLTSEKWTRCLESVNSVYDFFFLRYIFLFVNVVFGILVFFTLSFYLAKIACFVNLEYGFSLESTRWCLGQICKNYEYI